MKAVRSMGLLAVLSLFATPAFAAWAKFESCGLARHQSVMADVREQIDRTAGPNDADFLGYYELKKSGDVVGYLPYFLADGQVQFGHLYICSDFDSDIFYVDDEAAFLSSWKTELKKRKVLPGQIRSDEAVSKIYVTQLNESAILVDFFVRSLADNLVLKDKAVLVLEQKP